MDSEKAWAQLEKTSRCLSSRSVRRLRRPHPVACVSVRLRHPKPRLPVRAGRGWPPVGPAVFARALSRFAAAAASVRASLPDGCCHKLRWPVQCSRASKHNPDLRREPGGRILSRACRATPNAIAPNAARRVTAVQDPPASAATLPSVRVFPKAGQPVKTTCELTSSWLRDLRSLKWHSCSRRSLHPSWRWHFRSPVDKWLGW